MTTIPKLILHAGGAGAIFYGYNSVKGVLIHSNIDAQYGGSWQYLTIQGIHLAGLTLVISLVLDIFPSAEALKAVKRSLLVLTLPLNVVISLIYWPLILFFPALMLQKSAAPTATSDSPENTTMTEMLMYLPLEIDLALHAVPALALALDFFLFERKYGRKSTMLLAPFVGFVYAVCYACWVEYCGSRNNGIFPYPFLTENTFNVRLGIYAGAGLVAPLSFWVLNSFHT